MDVDLFVGTPVSAYPVALAWYERLLGSPPTFIATQTQAVSKLTNWEPNLPGGMRKAVYNDPDGNEFGIGGAPV